MRIATRARTQQMRTESAPWTAMREATPAAAGWTEQSLLAKHNDWEPAVAIDPAGQYIYILTTRYGVNSCKNCRKTGLALVRSTDGGATWEPWEWLWEDGDGWQADPQITVDDNGTAHALILGKWYRVFYTRSTDHGVTWSTPIDITGSPKWADYPEIAVSPDGMDVYVAYDRHINYQVTSNDGGFTWGPAIPTEPLDEDDFYYVHGSTVLTDETAVFTATDLACCPYADVAHRRSQGVWVIRTTDHGATWTESPVDSMKAPPPCTISECPPSDFSWGAFSSVASDPNDDVMLVYSGSSVKYGKQRLWFVTSTDGGATWSAPMPITTPQLLTAYPQIEATGVGAFVVTYVDARTRQDRLNMWVTETTDFGATWTQPDRLSNVRGGQPYKHRNGFQFFYGHYHDMDATSDGKTIAVWSESNEYWGPGNAWWAIRTPGP